MAIVNGTGLKKLQANSHRSQAVLVTGKVASPAGVQVDDRLRPLIIPGGTLVTRLSLVNADLGTTYTADIGFAPVDGSAGSATAFAADLDLATARAATAPYVQVYEGVEVARDSYLELDVKTLSAAAGGDVLCVVEGIGLGIK